MLGLRVEQFGEDDFGLTMMPVLHGIFGKPLSLPDLFPPCSLVGGSGESGRVDKCFDQKNGVAVEPLPILTESLQGKPQDSRCKIGQVKVWEDQESGVVGNEVEPLPLENRETP